MKHFLILFSCILFFSYSFGQLLDTAVVDSTTLEKLGQDPEAQKIMDKVSATTKEYKTIKLKFDYYIQDLPKDTIREYNGTLFLKGKKYKLFLMGNEIIYDETKLVTFMVLEKEATINNPPSGNDMMSPAELLTFYQDGFKYKYKGEFKRLDGKVVHEIDLFPAELDAKISRIRLHFNQEKTALVHVMYYGKDGVNHIFEITELKPNVVLTDAIFDFNPPEDVDVIDMRDE